MIGLRRCAGKVPKNEEIVLSNSINPTDIRASTSEEPVGRGRGFREVIVSSPLKCLALKRMLNVFTRAWMRISRSEAKNEQGTYKVILCS